MSGTYVGNNDIEWNYVNAKGGQKLESDISNAICLNKAADAEIWAIIPNGCTELKLNFEQEYSANVDASILINDSLISIIKSLYSLFFNNCLKIIKRAKRSFFP